MKERSFYSNLFFSLGLNLLVKPAAIFIIDAAVQNRVGDTYGIYFAFFNLSLILSILFDLGINNLNIKLAAQDLEQAKKRVSSILVLRILLLVLYISALVALKFLTSISWVEYKLILIFGINQFLIANISFFRSYFAGIQRFVIDEIFMGLLYFFTGGFCGIGTIINAIRYKELAFEYNRKMARLVYNTVIS